MPADREIEAVERANAAFYGAFAGRDLATMDEIWARSAPVSCIHPGWAPIFGREPIMESWAAILGNPASPPIRCVDPRVNWAGEMALVVCFESIGGALLAATNVFQREDGTWRLVHHQAGPMPELEESETPRGRLH